MRHACVHEAVLDLEPEGDERAPGGAVTMALCGSLDHPPPCPHVPHHTSVAREGEHVRARIVFATDDEDGVRRTIDEALRAGVFTVPDGGTTCWTLLASTVGTLSDEEESLGKRLVES